MITEIAENLYRVTLPMPFRLRHVHAYALDCGRSITLFDTGMHMPGAYEKLEADLESIGFSAARISDIYLTHTHTDHCGLTERLQEKSGARLHLTEIARQMHAHFEEGDYLIAEARAFYTRHGMTARDVEAVIEEIEDMKSRLPRLEVSTFLKDNEIRRAGNRTFEVIFTPGHAAGHACFFFRDEGLLLAGDHILPYIPPSLSPNIYDEIFLPLSSYLASLTVIENLPITVVHPGHGNSFGGVRERIDEIRAHHALKKEVLLNLVDRTPKTTFGICAQLIGAAAATWDDWEKFMALNETFVYLQQLRRDGQIRETLTNGVLYYTAD
ncbi:MAG: MBL fold metallo-hydrolase [Smithellaceae bacterium]|nr:MBL fold metallo-hydrolase [Syntrophaceae bacterium]MDD4240719.1 MBL fold metallo-hydrolase [Smithellaceae bacterium]NLX52774.1 MBL fold metallo-hydrolase [Deltaproteobacteria bacterium]